MRLHIRALGKFARLATLACLCVSFAPIWAAENAYVSVMASSGQVVCDGLDFYVVPTAVGHASGGGCCGWLVAVEIAMLGTQGISPDKHEGCKLNSIPGEDFSVQDAGALLRLVGASVSGQALAPSTPV